MQKIPTKPVFFDPENKRWPKVKLSFGMLSLASILILTVLVIGLIVAPNIKSLLFPNLKHAKNAEIKLSGKYDSSKFFLAKQNLLKEITTHNALAPKKNTDKLRIGFYVNWDDSSLYSLKDNLSKLDVVAGEWLHLSDANGNLVIDNTQREQETIDYIKSNQPSTKIWLLVNNYSGSKWDETLLSKALKSPASRKLIVEQLINHAQKYQLNGIALDFENLTKNSQNDYHLFLKELNLQASLNKLQISINLPADDNDYDYQAYANEVDYIIIMSYDEHWSSGQPGPIASQDWFDSIVDKRLGDIPKEKLIFAIGNYGYDWPEKSGQASAATFEEAMIIALESEGKISFDPNSLNSTFDYYDEKNQLHHVWLLDSASSFNELSSLNNAAIAGVALWRLGSEDPSIWQIFDLDTLDQVAANSISTVKFNYEVSYEGQGEILQISKTPTDGNRLIEYDQKDGIISDQAYITLPSPYIVRRLGRAEKKIALTFDDGPDPIYTPQILDVLKKYQVPATFFLIGANAEKYPDIVQREINEGHLIGNHTYSHPNISEVSSSRLRLEIIATERLFETITGRISYLFRSPYAEDSEPNNQAEVRPIAQIEQLGYINVGMQIDPKDWQQSGVDGIVSRAVSQAEKNQGNIVLLHDAGGSREQTIAALPKIIETLRQKGYQFVGTNDLLRKTREEIMPVSSEPQILIIGNSLAFLLFRWMGKILQALFLTGLLLGIVRLIFIASLAIMQKIKQKPISTDIDVSTAVIVPAYNENKVIVRTIESLLAADHPKKFEIIVVDDGSTDNTWDLLSAEYYKHDIVKIFKVSNGGKPAALNFGINQTTAEVAICLDADTIFSRNTITKLVSHFTDGKIGAVAGNAKVGNRVNLMTRWQALEYITSQNLDRRALTVLNAITVVPGAVGAWRRDAILKIGGFSTDTLAEDADLTVRLIINGYKITYEDEAIALTEAPETVRTFLKQRYRWMFGTLQMAYKNRSALFGWKMNWLGWFSLPSVFIYQIFFPLISPIMDLTLCLSLITALINKLQHPLEYSPENLHRVLLFYLIFLLADFLAGFIGFLLEKKEDKTLLFWLLLQRFFYRQLLYYVAIKSITASLRGNAVGWNKLERTGTMK
ncbi:MAG: polysaccharide deacetylase family protein [bacterium]